ncbi:MAG: cation-transporting P-type ATPase [Anaerolineaceae bacterium]|nr:cation-transporting P-type ATPase [Anaerolineaceae bacterium]
MSELKEITPEFLQQKQEMNAKRLYEALGSRPDGLTTAEAEARLATFGPNKIREIKGRPLLLKFVDNFTHMMAIMLWIAGIGAIVAKMPELAIAVWAVNLINGFFSFFQEFKAEKATEALKKILPQSSRVMRDGEEKKVLAEEIVPGDVIFFQEGDSIPVDCRLITSADLRVNQSTLTGESRAVNRSAEPVSGEGLTETEIPNHIFAGTFVAAGSGKAIAFATGMNTQFGRIAKLTQEVGDDLSPLQKEMQSATKIVTYIAVGVAIVFFMIAFFVAKINIVEAVLFTIGMCVAFVPEGMLPTVTLALAMGTQRMAKKHALIKKLSAVETLGCTTVICTDKTGTLTQNEMTVNAIWVPALGADGLPAGREIQVEGVGYEPIGKMTESSIEIDPKLDTPLRRTILTHAKCNTSRLLPPDPTAGDGQRWKVLGDPTEAALVVLANKAGYTKDEINANPNIAELPFDSRRKRMTVIQLEREADGRFSRVAHTKGGIREVLDQCDSILLGEQAVPITQAWIDAIMAVNDNYARQGLRVLAAANRVVPEDLYDYSIETVEQNLTYTGMVAMQDPPRPDVAAAVAKCHTAGIRIIMITGDYGLTAESIARRIGIVRGENVRLITGVELEKMNEADLREAVKEQVIFARVAPEHKLRVVSALQDDGNIVAVTGDGVNDAPALKKADIGVAMGITGSDVAKEAAEMILTDDNFGSIVNAIEEGRSVYENIKRFITYIFTSNFPESVPFILFAMTAGAIPLAIRVMQVLSIDLGTDMFPALAMAADPPAEGLMQLPPRKIDDHLITKDLLTKAYLIHGPLQGFAAMMAFYFFYHTNGFAGKWIGLPDETSPLANSVYYPATAMALAAVVMCQIGNLFTQRSSRMPFFKQKFFNNMLIWYGIGFEVLLILGIVYLPFLNTFIQTKPFPLHYWLFLIIFIPINPVADAIRKWLSSLKTKKYQKESQGGTL